MSSIFTSGTKFIIFITILSHMTHRIAFKTDLAFTFEGSVISHTDKTTNFLFFCTHSFVMSFYLASSTYNFICLVFLIFRISFLNKVPTIYLNFLLFFLFFFFINSLTFLFFLVLFLILLKNTIHLHFYILILCIKFFCLTQNLVLD